MLSMLIAYDANGNVTDSLSLMVLKDADGRVLGIVDFAAHEEAGGEHTDIWHSTAAVGSKVWPEWIDPKDFRVELEGEPGRKHIAALVHKVSGHRRERAAIEAAIQARIDERQAEADAKAVEISDAMPQPRDEEGRFLPKPEVIVEPEPADIRDLVGGPDRPLLLDDEGHTIVREPVVVSDLPLIGIRVSEETAVRSPEPSEQPERAIPRGT